MTRANLAFNLTTSGSWNLRDATLYKVVVALKTYSYSINIEHLNNVSRFLETSLTPVLSELQYQYKCPDL